MVVVKSLKNCWRVWFLWVINELSLKWFINLSGVKHFATWRHVNNLMRIILKLNWFELHSFFSGLYSYVAFQCIKNRVHYVKMSYAGKHWDLCGPLSNVTRPWKLPWENGVQVWTTNGSFNSCASVSSWRIILSRGDNPCWNGVCARGSVIGQFECGQHLLLSPKEIVFSCVKHLSISSELCEKRLE